MPRISRRIPVLAAALSLPLTLALVLHDGQPLRGGAPRVAVQLLAINDFHGNLQPPSGSNGQINTTAAGGAEYLATHLASAAAGNPNSIVVAAGDLIGASPLLSSLFHDEPTIEAMNAMNLAVSAVGNHEFDKGVGEILRLTRGGCHPGDGCQGGDRFKGAAFQYLSANIVRTATHTTLLPATAVRTVGGVRIGFIGETLQGTPDIVAAAGTTGLTFLDEAATANAYAARLKQQGVRAIVLLIHEGGRQRPGTGDPDPNGCANLDGAIGPIVNQLTADIQVVITGHTHTFYNCRIGGHLVTSAAAYGRMITRVNLVIDRASDRIESASATNEIVTRDVARNPALTRIIAKYGALSQHIANRVVGSVSGPILRLANAAGESPLGGVIADAQLTATSAAADGGAVVAFMNTGGIRSDIVANGTVPAGRAGEVTYGDLFRVQPFGNVMTVFTMTGDMITRLLEQQFDNPKPGEASMLQVSNGFTYRYRLNAPAGQHVEPDSIMIAGRRIGPTDRVRVEATDFLVGGGGGYHALSEGTDKIVVTADIDALVAYFASRSPIAPGAQDRVVRID